MSCAAARGTIHQIIAGASTATGTIPTTGTTMWDFVAPVPDFAGIFPAMAGVLFFKKKGSVHILSPALLPL